MEDKEVTAGSPAQTVDEKLLTQSQVNDLVGREKARAAERTRQELEARHREEIEKIRIEAAQQSGGNPVDTTEIERRVYDRFKEDLQKHREEAERQEFEHSIKSTVDQYYVKMGKGSELFDDFNEVMGDFESDKFPHTVLLAAKLDNTPEVMYELSKNPSKLQEIDSLAEKSPKMAMKQLEKLSKSIAQNLEAKQSNVSAPAPLSRLKSSSVGADTGKMTLKDLKAAPWLRG